MILAAADYAQERKGPDGKRLPLPDPLKNAWACQRWGCEAIFGPGALPEWLLDQMGACENVYEAHRADKMRTMPGDEWAERYPHYWQIVSHVQWLRMELKKRAQLIPAEISS